MRGREAEQQFRGPVPVVLCQSGYRDVQAKLVQDFFYGAHLSFPAVGDKKVGQGGVLLCGALVTASDDLLHRGIVIRAFHRLDVVFAVVFLGWFPFDEDHTAGHRVCPLDVGVVEAFDADGQAVQVQGFLYFLQQAGGTLFRVQLLRLFQPVGFVLLHVQDGQFEQGLLVSPLRYGENNVFQLYVERKRNDNLAGVALVAFAHFDDAHGQQFLLAFVQPLFILEGESLVDGSVRNVQVVDESSVFIGVLFDGEYVDVVQDVADDLRFRPGPASAGRAVARFHGYCPSGFP